MTDGAPLSPQERRGRAIIVTIALAILGPQLLLVGMVLFKGYVPGTAVLLRLGLSAVISWSLFKGYDWARRWVPVVFVIDALITIVFIVTMRAWQVGLAYLPFGVLSIAGAILIWRSESVDVFLKRQSAGRRALLSLRSEPPS
ncbi:MAG TPA: hypothetical protein VJV75_06990 [Candidatus Polarisedimenticolia bacterium]|nr:hypothetical protein [Candidatus Polarisedimenticolia bacterium]